MGAAGEPSAAILKDVYLLLCIFTACQPRLLKITGSLKTQRYIYNKTYSCILTRAGSLTTGRWMRNVDSISDFAADLRQKLNAPRVPLTCRNGGSKQFWE